MCLKIKKTSQTDDSISKLSCYELPSHRSMNTLHEVIIYANWNRFSSLVRLTSTFRYFISIITK